jgi:TolB protein
LVPVVCVAGIALLGVSGRLSGTPGDLDDEPAWSPDGQYIAFDSDRDGNYDIYTMKADGTNVVQLTENKYALLSQFVMIDTSGDLCPAWSPDGKKITFISGRENNMMSYVDFDVLTMNRDGTGVTNLTLPYANVELRPSWSSDGTRILYESDFDARDENSITEGKNWDIYVMDADGSRIVRLTYNPASDGQAAWSPDGSRIAFGTDRNGSSDIYLMDTNGTDQVPLLSGPANDEQPAWSPDGNRIAFVSDRGGNWDLYVIDADGSNIEKLTTGTAKEGHPAWSPDGNRIAFTSDRDGDVDIYVINTDGSNLIQLTGN